MDDDLYSRILNIPPGARPPHFYDLLGLELFESNWQTIRTAGVMQSAKLKLWQQQRRPAPRRSIEELMGAVAHACNVLEIPARKAAYDSALAATLGINLAQRTGYKVLAGEADLKKCPHCNVPMSQLALLCTECGFNIETGQRIETVVHEPTGPGAAGEPVPETAPAAEAAPAAPVQEPPGAEGIARVLMAAREVLTIQRVVLAVALVVIVLWLHRVATRPDDFVLEGEMRNPHTWRRHLAASELWSTYFERRADLSERGPFARIRVVTNPAGVWRLRFQAAVFELPSERCVFTGNREAVEERQWDCMERLAQDMAVAALVALAKVDDALAPLVVERVPRAGAGEIRAYIAILKGIRPDPGQAVPALCERIARDEDPRVRREALEAILPFLPLESANRCLLPVLAAVLKSGQAPCNAPAIAALAKVGAAGAPLLIEALNTGGLDVRKKAAHALGQMDPPTAGTVTALLRALGDREASVRQNAAIALGAVARKAPTSAVPQLIQALDKGSLRIRWGAVQALGRAGAPALEAFPALLRVLAVKHTGVRKDAVAALVALSKTDRAAADPMLVKALDSKALEVRQGAAQALAALGSVPPQAVPALLRGMADRDAGLRRSAVQALGAVSQAARAAAVPFVVEALEGGTRRVRRSAAQVLAQVGPAAAQAVPALVRVLAEPDPELRQCVIQALGAIASNDRSALRALDGIMRDLRRPEKLRAAAAQSAMMMSLPGSRWRLYCTDVAADRDARPGASEGWHGFDLTFGPKADLKATVLGGRLYTGQWSVAGQGIALQLNGELKGTVEDLDHLSGSGRLGTPGRTRVTWDAVRTKPVTEPAPTAAPDVSGYAVPRPAGAILSTDPRETVLRLAEPLGPTQKGQVAAKDDWLLAYGVYHLFRFPNAGKLRLSWTGKVRGEGRPVVAVWDGQRFRADEGLGERSSGTASLVVQRPSAETHAYLLVYATSGRILTDHAEGQPIGGHLADKPREEYKARCEALKPDDYAGHLALAVWCVYNGLDDRAAVQVKIALESKDPGLRCQAVKVLLQAGEVEQAIRVADQLNRVQEADDLARRVSKNARALRDVQRKMTRNEVSAAIDRCKGDIGRLKARIRDDTTTERTTGWKTCSACDGRGYVRVRKKCRACAGTGRVQGTITRHKKIDRSSEKSQVTELRREISRLEKKLKAYREDIEKQLRGMAAALVAGQELPKR